MLGLMLSCFNKISTNLGFPFSIAICNGVKSKFINKNCIKKRNARLVNLADCFVCYYYKSRSGTGQTIRMAQKNKLEIINLYE